MQKSDRANMTAQETIKVTFIKADNQKVTLDAPIGISVLTLAHMHQDKIFLEGACEGSLACSTCHVIVDPQWFNKLSIASDDEEDMLDMAFEVSQTSRLGCQITLTKELDGIVLKLPSATRNMQFNE